MREPLRIRFSLTLALLFLSLGLLLLVFGALNDRVPNLVLGALLTLLGGLQLTGTAVIVGEQEVELKNPLRMTVRRTPIGGLADLSVDRSRLVRASDGRRITSVGAMSARAEDVEMLRRAIDEAGTDSGTPA